MLSGLTRNFARTLCRQGADILLLGRNDSEWDTTEYRNVCEGIYQNTAQYLSAGINDEDLVKLVVGQIEVVTRLRNGVLLADEDKQDTTVTLAWNGNLSAFCNRWTLWRDQGEGSFGVPSPSLRNFKEGI